MAGPYGGKWGVVNGQSTVGNWSIADTSTPAPFIASNTEGGTARRRGVRDWTGSFMQFGATPLLMPGDGFTFGGYTSPDSGISGTGICFNGEAIIDQIVVVWDWSTGGIINTTLNFSGNGPLAQSTAEYTDATAPDAPESCGTKIETDVTGTPTWVEWENLTQATLTITSANQAYVNSSTANWTERVAGPIDWTLAVVQQDVARVSQAWDIDDEEVHFKLWIDAVDFWDLKWGIIKDFTGITVDRQTGAIIEQTVNIEMNGVDATGAGSITLPGAGAAWWPAP
jgi:hypothetical protein